VLAVVRSTAHAGYYAMRTPGNSEPSVPGGTGAHNQDGEKGDGAGDELQLLEALELTHWNRRHAARLLNLSYRTLLARVRRYQLGERPASDDD
jgi:transcriptional regulator with GAF, ATPase, and Fis domain